MNNHPAHALLRLLTRRRVGAIVALLIVLGGAIALRGSYQAEATLEPSLVATDPVAQESSLPSKRGLGWLRDLNLKPDQMRKIQAIRRQSRDQINRQRQEIQQSQQDLRSLLASDASADQVREKYRQVQRGRDQLADAQFNSLLEMRQVLNPTQRRTFADRMQPRKEVNGRTPRS